MQPAVPPCHHWGGGVTLQWPLELLAQACLDWVILGGGCSPFLASLMQGWNVTGGKGFMQPATQSCTVLRPFASRTADGEGGAAPEPGQTLDADPSFSQGAGGGRAPGAGAGAAASETEPSAEPSGALPAELSRAGPNRVGTAGLDRTEPRPLSSPLGWPLPFGVGGGRGQPLPPAAASRASLAPPGDPWPPPIERGGPDGPGTGPRDVPSLPICLASAARLDRVRPPPAIGLRVWRCAFLHPQRIRLSASLPHPTCAFPRVATRGHRGAWFAALPRLGGP